MKRFLLVFIIILSFCLLLVSCDSDETRDEQGPQGIQGEQGIQGPQGPKGEDGEDGRGVEKFEIIDGELIIYYTDGTTQNLGKIQEEKDDPEEEGTAGLEYHELDDGTLAVGLGTVKFLTKIVIPSKHDGKVVSAIMDEGFKDYDKLKNIEIPDSITAIMNNAFSGCTSLESIVIPNSVTTIGSSAFAYCDSLAICCEAESKPNDWTSSWNYSNCPVVWGCKANGTTEDGLSWAQDSNNEITITKYVGTSTSVEIPSSINSLPVTAIASRAFYECYALTSVTIPSGVTTIGSNAFYYCYALTSVDIPNSVTLIGSNAFKYCSALTSIAIPNGVTEIGDGAFYGCSKLASVTIPNGVTAIESYAFYECYALTSIAIPNGVTEIGDGAFYGCSKLANVTIPNGVIAIEDSAFCRCSALTSVTIPNSVTTIGDSAFYYCSALTSVVIPNSVTKVGSGAFESYTSFEIYCEAQSKPNGWSSDWNGSSWNNSKHLVVWDCKANGTTEDGLSWAQDSNNEITIIKYTGTSTSLEIPSSINLLPVTAIRESAFSSHRSLENVTIPDSITTIGNYAFYGCTSLESIVIPNSVTTIGASAFSNCSALTSVNIPNSVTSIGESAFYACTSVEIYCEAESKPSGWDSSWNGSYRPAVWSCKANGTTGDGLRWMQNLNDEITIIKYTGTGASVEIPSSINSLPVIAIRSEAFYNCTSITSVTIPSSVTSIGFAAFGGCRSLASITIPSSVTTIGYSAFSCCSALTSITIPDGVTTIESNAFYGCSKLTSVIIPNSVTTIETSAFEACTSLESVFIPNSVNTIENSAFYGCALLERIVIPNSVTLIEGNAFYRCLSLAIYCEAESKPSEWGSSWNYDSHSQKYHPVVWGYNPTPASAFTYTISDGKVTITGYTGTNTEVVIPFFIEGYPVTAIGYEAFRNCTSLTSITIPNGVTSMGDCAFELCTSLASITIPSSVTSIGDCAFDSCDSLKSIFVPSSVTVIGREAFAGCDSITVYCEAESKPSDWDEEWDWCYIGSVSVVWGYELTPASAFTYTISGDGKVTITGYTGTDTEVVIPFEINGYPVTAIGEDAFLECTSLESVVIPSSVTMIGNSAFCGCINLISLTIPNSVTEIGNCAFEDCDSLEKICIPNSVTTMGHSVFLNCDSFTVYCEAENRPSDWNGEWDWSYHSDISVVWGHTHTYTSGKCVCGKSEN